MLDAISEIQAKDIILLLAGSGITIILVLHRTIKEYLEKYRLVTPLLRTWHTYHFSRSNYEPILRAEKWVVKRNLFGISIKTNDGERKSLTYVGGVSFDSGHLTISMKGVNHPEEIQYRMTQPIPNDDTMMLGFYVGKDFDHELYSAFKLICEKERTPEEAEDIIREAVIFSERECCIRLSKEPIRANKSN